MTNFDNLTPNTTAFVDSDNNVQDLEQVLTSGAVIVTASAAGPVVPVGTEVTPLFENITPWAGKFVDESNNIVDLLQFLTSGAIQVQVVGGGGGGGAPTNATYITQTSDLVALPNSVPLSSMVSGLLSSTTGTGALRAVTLSGTANQLVVTNGTGVAGNPTVSLSPMLVFPGTATLGGNLEVAGYTITQTGGLGILTMSAPVSIDLVTPWVTVNGIRHYTDSGNKILFGTQLVQLLPNNTLQLEANASGVRLFSGPAVNSISTDGTLSSNSDSTLATQKATKTYVDTNQNALKAATFITATNETAMLPNSTALSGLPNGFAMVYSGLLETQILTGTANQINIAGGDASLTAPVFSLSSTLVTPGTLDVGTTFSVGGTGSITSITTNPASVSANALMPASTIQAAISAAITAGTSFRGGWSAAGGLYPTTGGSGPAGAVAAGDWWYITVGGTLNTTPVNAGDQIFALVATPGQTDANWLAVGEHVSSVFGRNGAVVATSGDYSFSLISGTAAYTQGGTGLTASGTSGNLLTSTGSGWVSAAPVIPSVFGRTGAITAATNDYSFSQISGTAAVSQGGTGITAPGVAGNVLTSDGAGNWTSAAPSAGSVTSVFGRTGAVVATSGDYSFSQISGTAAVTQGGTGLTSTTINQLLYSSAANTIAGLATANNAILGTDATGVPGFVGASPSQGQIIIATVAGVWTKSTTTYPEGNATAGTLLRASGTGFLPTSWTVPNTFGINNMVYASGSNTLAAITPVNSAIMRSSATGVPGWSATLTDGQLLIGSTGATPAAATLTQGTGITITNGAGAITITNSDGGSAVTLTNAGTTSLVNDGTGPALATKGLVAGAGMAAFGVSGTDVTINLTIPVVETSGGTNQTTYTKGDILHASAANTLAKLAIGSTGNVLTVSGGDTVWASPAVSSVFGRTGAVVATSGDYSFSLISGTAVETQGGTNQTTYATGDMLYASAANTLSKLTVGASGKFLSVAGGVPVWSNATLPATAPSAGKLLRSDATNWISSTATYPDTVTAGDLLYASASNTVSSLAVGSTGQVLTVVAGAPAWAAATGGGLTFNTVTTSTQAMAVNNTYYSTYAGTCVMTLPVSAAVGSIIEIITDTSHLIQIAQNSGQLIYCGALNGVSQVTTTGTGGSITTVDPNTVIAIKCIVTDTTWTVIYANNNSYSGV